MLVGISDFYRENNRPGSGNSYTTLSESALTRLVQENWHNRKPGRGETNTDRKVVVPIPVKPGLFFTGFTRDLRIDAPIQAKVERRKSMSETEAPTIQTFIPGEWARKNGIKMEEANFVSVVCYSADALLENDGKRSSKADWEIVTIICSPIENEHMSPITMARNHLELPGGTKSIYHGREYAEAIHYWHGRVRVVG